jgi:hypothetical protein
MKIIFALLVALVFGYTAWEAISYPYLAKIFPLSISIVFLLLALISLGLDIRSYQKEKRKTESVRRDIKISAAAAKNEEEGTRSMSIKEVCSYIGLLYLGIWLIGYPLSITTFIIVFYRFIGKTDWVLASVIGIIGFDFIILVSEIMTLDWPAGLIPLPWPLG